MTTDDKQVNVDNLAKAIARDISNLTRNAAQGGKLKSVRDVDLTPLFKGTGIKNLQAATNSFRARAEESSKKTKAVTQKISGQVETSIQERQTRLETNLKELSNTSLKDDDEAKIILKRASAEVKTEAFRLNEIEIEKRVKPVIRLSRPQVGK